MDGNPFIHRGPIDDPVLFFGRQRELTDCLRHLRATSAGVWIEVTGPHRMGKSSFLRSVRHRSRGEEPTWVVGSVNLQRTVDTADVWRCLTGALGGSPADTQRPSLNDVCGRLDAVAASGGRAVLLLDEAPVLTGPGRDHGIFDRLRGLSEDYPLAVVTVAPAPLHTYIRTRFGVSPAWANRREIGLPTFTESESHDFLKARLKGAPLQFTDAQSTKLFALTGGHPWRLTVAAFHLYDELARGGPADGWRTAYERERQADPREVVRPVPAGESPAYDPSGSSEIRVFISSPVAGAEQERQAVKKGCVAAGLHPVMAEELGARDGTCREVCLGELRRCQLLVLVMPHRYGPPTDLGVSATQEEVEEAARLGMPRLVYVADEGELRGGSWWRPFAERAADARDARQRAWVEMLTGRFGDGLYKASYSIAADLRDRVSKDLRQLVHRRARWALDHHRVGE